MRKYVAGAAAIVCSVVLLGTAGCQGDTGGAVKDDLTRLAAKAEEDFAKRGQGTFYDSGFRSYCRANTGFDEGLFKDIGFVPATKDYEFCYNVTDDLKKVALGATSVKDGKVQCLVIDASSGTPARGEITAKEPCVP